MLLFWPGCRVPPRGQYFARADICTVLLSSMRLHGCLWWTWLLIFAYQPFSNVSWSRICFVLLQLCRSAGLGVRYSEELTMSGYLKANSVELVLNTGRDNLLNKGDTSSPFSWQALRRPCVITYVSFNCSILCSRSRISLKVSSQMENCK